MQQNEKDSEWFQRIGDVDCVSHLTAERRQMERKRAAWAAIKAILDATTDEEMQLAGKMLEAADKLSVPAWHSKNGHLNLEPAATGLGDLLRIGFPSYHPAVDTDEYRRFAETFLGVIDE